MDKRFKDDCFKELARTTIELTPGPGDDITRVLRDGLSRISTMSYHLDSPTGIIDHRDYFEIVLGHELPKLRGEFKKVVRGKKPEYWEQSRTAIQSDKLSDTPENLFEKQCKYCKLLEQIVDKEMIKAYYEEQFSGGNGNGQNRTVEGSLVRLLTYLIEAGLKYISSKIKEYSSALKESYQRRPSLITPLEPSYAFITD